MNPDERPISDSTAPPIQPAPIEAPRPAWPAVIGIIAIVFGSLGLLDGLAGTATTFLTSMFGTGMGSSVPEVTSAMQEAIASKKPWLILVNVVLVLLGGLLLASGIGLLLRRSWGVTLAIVWALLKLIVAPVDKILEMQLSSAVQEAMANDPNFAGAMPGFMSAFTNIATVVAVGWGWMLPVFVLVWLSRAGSRKEIQTWKADDRRER